MGRGGGLNITVFFLKWGFIPDELSRGIAFEIVSTHSGPVNIESPVPTWATIFSSMFIHGGLVHFAGNMMFLWVFGDNIEGRLGHVKYLLFYLGTGVVATLSHLGRRSQLSGPAGGGQRGHCWDNGRLFAVISLQPDSSSGNLLLHYRDRATGPGFPRDLVFATGYK